SPNDSVCRRWCRSTIPTGTLRFVRSPTRSGSAPPPRPTAPHPRGWRSRTLSSVGLLCLQSVGDESIGVPVTHPVFLLQPVHELHVHGEIRRADHVLPLLDRASVLLHDRRKIR